MPPTTFLLIRHASHDLLGNVLAGRTVDIELNANGRGEAQSLCERLSGVRIDEMLVSPRARALATAAPLAACLALTPRVYDAIDEVDLGDWSGCSFAQLSGDAEWRTWCEARTRAQPPNGESIMSVQKRVARGMSELAVTYRAKTIAMVSHGDVIKAALSYYLSISLDSLERFDVAPASVSAILVNDGWAQVKLVNDTGIFNWS